MSKTTAPTTSDDRGKKEPPKKKPRKKATTEDGYNVNEELKLRVPKYPLPMRFDDPDTKVTKRKGSNQHTQLSFEDDFDATYAWVVSNTQIRPSPGGGHFKCWILNTDAKGIKLQESGGYARISFRGAYYMAHVFAWLYLHPGQRLQHDASHECGNKLCIRHIADETREYNNSRSGCLGYVMNPDGTNIIKLCTHESPCKRVTLYDQVNIVVLPIEQ